MNAMADEPPHETKEGPATVTVLWRRSLRRQMRERRFRFRLRLIAIGPAPPRVVRHYFDARDQDGPRLDFRCQRSKFSCAYLHVGAVEVDFSTIHAGKAGKLCCARRALL